MSTLKTNNIEPVSGNGITINSSVNVTGGITASLTTPNVLTFDPISTPSVTTGGMFYSSSGNFYIESSSAWAPVLTTIPRTPNSSSYDAIVQATYPQAVDSYHFGEVAKSFISGTFGYVSDNIVLANSICSDDVDGPVFINEINIGQFPSSLNQFLGPFMAGGLAGYPHTGRLAVAAWASHVTTETSGALFLINMPHIGITQQADLVAANDNVGRMHRRGKASATGDQTCGAAFFAYTQSAANILGLSVPPTASEYVDNFQWFTLVDILYPFSASFTGSYTGSLIGTLAGTASWAQSASNALTSSFVTASNVWGPFGISSVSSASYASGSTSASYAISSSWAVSASQAVTASSADSFIIRADTFEFTGSIKTSGSIELIGNFNVLGRVSASSFTGSYTGSFTGSLLGTSSWAQSASNAISASQSTSASFASTSSYVIQALSASFVTASNVWGPNGSNSILTASYALSGLSGIAATASFVTASNVWGPFGASSVSSASYASGSTSASFASFTVSASYASGSTSASYASGSTSASFTLFATSASYASGSTSASYALSASNAVSSSWAVSASQAITSSYTFLALTSSFVTASNVWGIFGSNSVLSSSYASGSTSASYSLTASYIDGGLY
jgi:hypothetical protein